MSRLRPSVFESTTQQWDIMRLTRYDERVIEVIADAIAVEKTQTLLDAGSGTGFAAAGLAPRPGRVLALDRPQRDLERVLRGGAEAGGRSREGSNGTAGNHVLGNRRRTGTKAT